MKTFNSTVETDNLDMDERDDALKDFDVMLDKTFACAKDLLSKGKRVRVTWTTVVEEVPQ